MKNDCAYSGCVSFKKFVKGLGTKTLESLDVVNDVTFAFHGTSHLQDVCCDGWNVKLRSGQSFGPGEYFSKEKDESLKYANSGSHPKSLIVVAILTDKISPSQQHVVVTNAQNNDEAYVLPLIVITFDGAQPPFAHHPNGCAQCHILTKVAAQMVPAGILAPATPVVAPPKIVIWKWWSDYDWVEYHASMQPLIRGLRIGVPTPIQLPGQDFEYMILMSDATHGIQTNVETRKQRKVFGV